MSELTLGMSYTDEVVVKPAPNGLLGPATTVIVDEDPHWAMGLDHRVSDFVKVSVVHGEGANAKSVVIHEGDDDDFFRNEVPFVIKVEFKASTFGTTPQEVNNLIEMYIEAATQKAVEREFWTGELRDGMDDSNHLASTAAEVVNPSVGSPVKTKYGLALLEQALGDHGIGERGVIHATRGVASALGFKGSNGRIETPIGNYLVAGTGYTGSGPEGTAPSGDQAWMYATGPVVVRLGPSEMYQDSTRVSIDTRNNTIHYQGYRAASAYWTNNSHFAVLVDLAEDYS